MVRIGGNSWQTTTKGSWTIWESTEIQTLAASSASSSLWSSSTSSWSSLLARWDLERLLEVVSMPTFSLSSNYKLVLFSHSSCPNVIWMFYMSVCLSAWWSVWCACLIVWLCVCHSFCLPVWFCHSVFTKHLLIYLSVWKGGLSMYMFSFSVWMLFLSVLQP